MTDRRPVAWRVPRFWAGETVFLVAGGPSLRETDLEGLRAGARRRPPVLAINDAYRLLPQADLLYFCDYKWFVWHREAVEAWPQIAATLSVQAAQEVAHVHWLRQGDIRGLAARADTLNTGRNSGYQAINLAVHAGARRLVLVGYDLAHAADGASHWHGGHQGRPSRPGLYRDWLPHFDSLRAALLDRRVAVVNATRGGALEAFPRAELADEIERWRAEASAAARSV